jgi:hypothetical protein
MPNVTVADIHVKQASGHELLLSADEGEYDGKSTLTIAKCELKMNINQTGLSKLVGIKMIVEGTVHPAYVEEIAQHGAQQPQRGDVRVRQMAPPIQPTNKIAQPWKKTMELKSCVPNGKCVLKSA